MLQRAPFTVTLFVLLTGGGCKDFTVSHLIEDGDGIQVEGQLVIDAGDEPVTAEATPLMEAVERVVTGQLQGVVQVPASQFVSATTGIGAWSVQASGGYAEAWPQYPDGSTGPIVKLPIDNCTFPLPDGSCPEAYMEIEDGADDYGFAANFAAGVGSFEQTLAGVPVSARTTQVDEGGITWTVAGELPAVPYETASAFAAEITTGTEPKIGECFWEGLTVLAAVGCDILLDNCIPTGDAHCAYCDCLEIDDGVCAHCD